MHPTTVSRDCTKDSHAVIWEEIADERFTLPADKPLTLAAYESALTIKASVETMAVGDPLPKMPLYLEPDSNVPIRFQLRPRLPPILLR